MNFVNAWQTDRPTEPTIEGEEGGREEKENNSGGVGEGKGKQGEIGDHGGTMGKKAKGTWI